MFIIFQTIYMIQLTIVHGKISLIFVTFTFAFVLDQIKSFAVLSTIYIIVVRRFGFLKENEKEWVKKEHLEQK